MMKEDIAAPISSATCGGKLERVMVIFNHTVQHENIISITEHRSSVMWNERREDTEECNASERCFLNTMWYMWHMFELVF